MNSPKIDYKLLDECFLKEKIANSNCTIEDTKSPLLLNNKRIVEASNSSQIKKVFLDSKQIFNISVFLRKITISNIDIDQYVQLISNGDYKQIGPGNLETLKMILPEKIKVIIKN
jgi:hypothetical protein